MVKQNSKLTPHLMTTFLMDYSTNQPMHHKTTTYCLAKSRGVVLRWCQQLAYPSETAGGWRHSVSEHRLPMCVFSAMNPLLPKQNIRRFQTIFANIISWKHIFCILINVSYKFVLKGWLTRIGTDIRLALYRWQAMTQTKRLVPSGLVSVNHND